MAALVEQRILEIAEGARRAADSRDPGRGLRKFMASAVAAHICDRGFCQAAGTPVYRHPRLGELLDELTASIDQLLQRAKDAGEVREDVTAADIPILVLAVAQAGIKLEPSAHGAWHRYLDIVLDGLRPEGARPLSRKPPTRRQVEAARHGAFTRARTPSP